MIDDGPRFKLGLYRAAKRFDLDLERWPYPPVRGGEEWGDYWQTRFEETLFRIGLGVRKLVEAAKLSVQAQVQPVAVAFAPLAGSKLPGAINYHRIEDFYDLANAQPQKETVMAICHAIVHSFVLVPRFTVSGVDGLRLKDFILASDRSRRHGVYIIEWRRFVDDLVWRVYADDVVAISMRGNGNGDEVRLPSSLHPTDAEWQRIVQLYSGLSRSNRSAVDRLFRGPASTPAPQQRERSPEV